MPCALAVVLFGACLSVHAAARASCSTCGARRTPEQSEGSGPGAEQVLLQIRASRGIRSLEDETCHTLVEGEPGYLDVHWASLTGIYDYPHWYPSLSPASTFEDFQGHLRTSNPGRFPKPCPPTFAGTVGEACISRAVRLDFFNSQLAHKNLGGLGPDEGSMDMRYTRVGRKDGRPFDLVVRNTSFYRSHNQGRNGLAGGDGGYGIINVKAGSAVDLHFSFEDSESKAPLVLPAFHFSFLDLDESRRTKERLSIGGFENYTLDSETEVAVKPVAGGAVFESTRVGFLCDNPRDPMTLGEVTCKGQSVNQKRRAVTFLFSNVSGFDLNLEASCRKNCGRQGGRNFLFAGSSALSYSCEEAPKLGLCAAFGDPHFVTFDGAHTVFMGHMAIWLVRSHEIWMQAASKEEDGKFQGLAIGGPFMRGHRLIVKKTSPTTLQASFDGEDILVQATDEFHVKDIVDGFRREEWNASLHNEGILKVRTEIQFSVGPWPERFIGSPAGGLYLLRLPGEVEVTITGVDFMSVVITMPPQLGGQGGYCGNFNGDEVDDFEPTRRSFHKPAGTYLGPVDSSELLFDRDWLGGDGAEGEGASLLDPESVVRDCDESLKAVGARRCRMVTDRRLKEDCLFDVCASGKVDAADGILSAEILEEKVNSRGIPVFIGRGRCLDVVGQTYTAIDTTLTTERDCTMVLRSLAITAGVFGAQMSVGQPCQILVRPGIDLARVAIKGGWGRRVSAGVHGRGMVSGCSHEASWKCWRLV